jgi:hypothetical protein
MKYSFSALVVALGIFTFLLFAQKKRALLPAAPTTYGAHTLAWRKAFPDSLALWLTTLKSSRKCEQSLQPNQGNAQNLYNFAT